MRSRLSHTAIFCAIILIPLASPITLRAQARLPAWAGTWRGKLANLPAPPGAPEVEVTIELEPFPAADSVCSLWRNTYSEHGTVKQVKDYHLCRGHGPDDLYVDEGNGTKLTARLLGDVLVTPFKVDGVVIFGTLRLRGDALEEEILSADDKPSTSDVLALAPRPLQRIVLRRVSPGGS
jgi:hypothetical protein